MQKPLTPKRLENISLYYLERFEASSEKLRQVLKRRVQKQKMLKIFVDKNIYNWIEEIIKKMQTLGYIDDIRYTQNTIRRLSEKGKSSRYIQQKLIQEGLSKETISKYLTTENDFERALKMIQKKHLQNTEKDLAKLARAGFSYNIAKDALKQQGEKNV